MDIAELPIASTNWQTISSSEDKEDIILKQLDIIQKARDLKSSLPLDDIDKDNFAKGVTTLFENIANLTKFESESCQSEG